MLRSVSEILRRSLSHFFRWIFIALISLYQVTLGFFLGGRCRFYPSCSHYGKEAFRVHPPFTAFKLTFLRLIKCHPWGSHGFDPVPPAKNKD